MPTLTPALLDEPAARRLYDSLHDGGDEDSMVDDWQAVPELVEACRTARAHSGPGSHLYDDELGEYLTGEYENYFSDDDPDAPGIDGWVQQLFADDKEWEHFGTLTEDGITATAWATRDPEHLGVILFQRGEQVTVGAFAPV